MGSLDCGSAAHPAAPTGCTLHGYSIWIGHDASLSLRGVSFAVLQPIAKGIRRAIAKCATAAGGLGIFAAYRCSRWAGRLDEQPFDLCQDRRGACVVDRQLAQEELQERVLLRDDAIVGRRDRR